MWTHTHTQIYTLCLCNCKCYISLFSVRMNQRTHLIVPLLYRPPKWLMKDFTQSPALTPQQEPFGIYLNAAVVGIFFFDVDAQEEWLGGMQCLFTTSVKRKFAFEFHLDVENSWLGERRAPKQKHKLKHTLLAKKQQQKTWYDAVDWFTESWHRSCSAQLQFLTLLCGCS